MGGLEGGVPMWVEYAFNGWAFSFVMFLSLCATGYVRKKFFAGAFLVADVNVRDAINGGVGIYILAFVLLCLHIDKEVLNALTQNTFGAISVNGSFALVILTRLEAIVVSAKNGPKTQP